METKTREEMAQEAPSFEELIDKVRTITDDFILIHQNLISVLVKGDNENFNLLLNKLFLKEVSFKSFDAFKEFIISKLNTGLIHLQQKKEGKLPKKKDEQYYSDLNDRVKFEEKYEEIFSFAEKLILNTNKEIVNIKGLVEGIVK